MPQIRIKRAPQMGDQRDFSLFDRRTMNPGPVDTSQDVQNTMGPVPRDKASIEVERGEVVIGDTNQDGFLELFTFTGKPHSKGGTPVDIPIGSFIYSNTRKLRIKDPEVLSKVFDMSPSKQGYTPAEIAKKYQINQYVADLKSESTDNITKRSADQMLKNNLNKLGMLALIQESMKGFPDGIPAIAESAALGLGINPQQMQAEGPESMENPNMPDEPEMPQARWGGLRKFQTAGTYFSDHAQTPGYGPTQYTPGPFGGGFLSTTSTSFNGPVKRPTEYVPPAKGTKFYRDDFEPVEVVEADPSTVAGNWVADPFTSPYIKLSDGTYMSQAEYMYLMNSGSNRYKGMSQKELTDLAPSNLADSKLGQSVNSSVNSSFNPVITTQPVVRSRQIPDQYGNPTGLSLSTGDDLFFQGKNWKVINPYGEYSDNYMSSGKRWRDMFDNTNGIILVQDPNTKEYDYIEGEDLGDTYKVYPAGITVLKGHHLPGGAGNTQQNNSQNFQGAASSAGSSYGNAPILNPEIVKDTLTANPDTAFYYNQENGTGAFGPKEPLKVETKREKKKAKSTSTPNGARIKVYTADDFKVGGEYIMPHYNTTFEYGGSYSHDGLPIHQSKGPVQEKYIGPNKSNTADNYQQANGDIIMRERGTGKVLAIKHTNGDVSNVYPDRIERTNNKGAVVDISAPDPTQLWHDTDWKGKYMDDHAEFEKLWKDPANQDLKNAMYEEFKKIAAVSPNSKELLAMKPEEALSYMLEGNKQNSMIQSAYADQPEYLQSERWDKASVNKFTDATGKVDDGKNLYYRKAAQKLGLTPQNEVQTQAFQAMYQAAQRLARQPEYMDRFKNFDINPVGVADQTTMGEAVSPVEGWRGNTTVGQLGRLKADPTSPKKDPEPEMLKAYYCVEQADGSKNVQTVTYKKGEAPQAPTGSKVTPYDSLESAQANCGVDIPQDFKQESPKPIAWWGPDIMNFTGAVTDKVHRFEPMLQQVDLKTPGYDTENYDTMVNNARGQQRELQSMLENTASGPQSVAAALGTNNFEGITNAIAGVQARNNATVNQAATNISTIENQERLANVNGRDKYMQQMAILDQQQANDEQKKKWREIGAFNNGLDNWYKHKKMEQVLFPQVHDDSITGDVSFSGNGRNVFGPDTYVNPYTSAHGTAGADNTTVMNTAMKYYKSAYDNAIANGYSDDVAKKMAEAEHARVYRMATPNANMRQQYMNAMFGSGYGGYGATAATSPYDFDPYN